MEDSTEVQEILERLKQAVGAKSKTDLAKSLGLAQQSVFNAQAKGKIPDGWIRKVAKTYNVSADWLFFGEGHMYRGEAAKSDSTPELISRDVLLDVVEILEESLIAAKKKLPPKSKAELIYQLYHLVLEEEAKQQPIRMFKLIQGALAANE